MRCRRRKQRESDRRIGFVKAEVVKVLTGGYGIQYDT
jgi:hypothetical protein